MDNTVINFEAHVGNIGCVGSYPNKTAAVRACRETIKASARADKCWFVQRDSDGEIVASAGV